MILIKLAEIFVDAAQVDEGASGVRSGLSPSDLRVEVKRLIKVAKIFVDAAQVHEGFVGL